MPLSFASMLGGCCTLLGTSTNLVANAVLNSAEYEYQTLTMFELAPVGLPLTIVGSFYMAVASGWLLQPSKEQDAEEAETGAEAAQGSRTISFRVGS